MLGKLSIELPEFKSTIMSKEKQLWYEKCYTNTTRPIHNWLIRNA